VDRLRFGDYCFELESERLFSGERELRLTPKAAAVLGVLVRAAGNPVSKAQLFAEVWRGTIVSDDALTSCIQEVRRALGDDAKRPRFIETRHRRGYRFIAPLLGTPPDGRLVPGQREREGWRWHLSGVSPYEYYLRGRQRLPQLTRADLRAGRDMFERAIDLDGDYAPAWAGLATAHATLYEWFGARPHDLAAAESAAQRALGLAPGLADAHVARGFVLTLKSRHDQAKTHFEEAIAIDRDLFDAYYWFARASFARGEIERSADLFRRAAHVRPEDFQSPILLGQSLRMLGSVGKAREANREGIRRAGRKLDLNPLDNRALSLGSSALFTDGQTQRSREWSERSLQLHPDDPPTLVLVACMRAKARLGDEALDLLERVSAQGCGKRDWIARDPDFASLRGHPRFAKVLARLQ